MEYKSVDYCFQSER